MKQEDKNILDKLGKQTGFQVPEGYFEHFTQQMVDQLPDIEITDVEAKPSLWVRVRPYVYMAAMFAGIWCMMQIFNHANGTAGGSQSTLTGEANTPGVQQTTVDDNGQPLDADKGKFTYQDSVNANMQRKAAVVKK